VSIYSISNTHLLLVQYITDTSWQSETHTFYFGLILNKNKNLERNVLSCPTVVSDPNVVIKCKENKKKHHTLGTIPKSTTSILVAWYRYFNVNEQKFQASPQNVQ
jgi:hypothetical protein